VLLTGHFTQQLVITYKHEPTPGKLWMRDRTTF